MISDFSSDVFNVVDEIWRIQSAPSWAGQSKQYCPLIRTIARKTNLLKPMIYGQLKWGSFSVLSQLVYWVISCFGGSVAGDDFMLCNLAKRRRFDVKTCM